MSVLRIFTRKLFERKYPITMAGEHLSTNGYSPLPQSISNTDTEDEDEHLTRANHTIQRKSEDTTMVVSMTLNLYTNVFKTYD